MDLADARERHEVGLSGAPVASAPWSTPDHAVRRRGRSTRRSQCSSCRRRRSATSPPTARPASPHRASRTPDVMLPQKDPHPTEREAGQRRELVVEPQSGDLRGPCQVRRGGVEFALERRPKTRQIGQPTRIDRSPAGRARRDVRCVRSSRCPPAGRTTLTSRKANQKAQRAAPSESPSARRSWCARAHASSLSCSLPTRYAATASRSRSSTSSGCSQAKYASHALRQSRRS